MSAEYAAEQFAEAIADIDGASADGLVDEDMRSGGWFFDVEFRGSTYEVLVVEVRDGAR